MNSTDFSAELYCRVDDLIADAPRHSPAILSSSAVVSISMLYAVKGVSPRAFYTWLRDNYGHLFPQTAGRTRLFRRLQNQQYRTEYLRAEHTMLGIADSYGVELCHPIRDGRRAGKIGSNGISNHTWIVVGKLCTVINKLGLTCDWAGAPANVNYQTFQPLLIQYDGQMIILADQGFRRAADNPPLN